MSKKLQTDDGQSAVQSATFCLSLLIGLLLAVASPGLSSFFPPPGWGCPPCNRSHCPPIACDESLQYADECGCCSLCAKLEEEACGGRGNAGGSCNGSGLHCAYRLGSIFGEERFGICENSLCHRRLCGYRQRCKVVVGDDRRDSTLCSCDHFLCDHKCNLVCGRDDKTYSSVSHLQLAECLSGHPIGIRHFSQCKVVCPPKPKKIYNNLYSAPPPIYCIHEEEMYSPFHILPPTSRNPCTYHVCSDYGHMEQYPVPGCEGNPLEEDWKVEEAIIPASWTEWSPYSRCVGDCEKGGWANRTRTCTAPSPSSHVEAGASALYCQGADEDSKLCEPEGCRICHITQWSRWSECSTVEPCQQGWQTRGRTITNIPTVPQLCGSTFENRTCQFVGPCTTCAMRQTGWFNIVDKHNGCFNRRPGRGVVCVGSCEPGKCCSAIFNERDHSTALYFVMDCPDQSVQPYLQSFFLPVNYECVDCNNVRAPNFLDSRWRIKFRP